MSQSYWISEYLRLMAAYGFVIYIWPSVVFEKHLRGKNLRYRFGFCITVPLLLINTAVLVLGLAHALRPWVTSLMFLGVFFWRLLANHPLLRALGQDLRALVYRSMSLRRLLLRLVQRLWEGARALFTLLMERARGNLLEYTLLLIALVFGTIYFSYGAFDEHSYGFGDQYVHHQWIYGLVEGKAFYNGIYPEGMHCVIYLTCTLFHIPLYSGVLFFGGLHVHVFLISVWIFMKEVFRWRYSALIALAMFLCFDQLCVDEVFSMSRLSWTLPMEYALFGSFLCGAFLLRFLRRVLRGHRVELHPLRPKQWGVVHDEDLFLFSATIAASLAVHFYVTIVAAIFCMVVALVYLRQCFRRGSFLPLAAAVCLGFFVAVLPMGAAYAAGYPLQGSLYWAVSVIEDNEAGASTPQQTSAPEPEGAAQEETVLPSEDAEQQDTAAEPTLAAPSEAPVREAFSAQRVLALLESKAKKLWSAGYHTLYPSIRSTLIVLATAFALVSAACAHIVLALRDWKRRRKAPQGEEPPPPQRDLLDGVLITALVSVLLMMIYCARALGLPQLIAGSRLCSTEQVLLVMLYALPLDYLAVLLARLLKETPVKVLSAAAFFGVYMLAQLGGFFHSFLYYELTRYDAAVEMTNRIIDTLPPQMYTIISTTDELYQVIEHGYHEELLTFLQREEDGNYMIPTPYLLLYIEKHPIRYAQNHFASGPRWLAREEYPALYPATGSQCPSILSSEISEEAAKEHILYGAKLSDSASSLEGRTILESKAWAWYQTFSAMHPRHCSIIYEDEDFLCCRIIQNPGSLFTLGIMGQAEEGK